MNTKERMSDFLIIFASWIIILISNKSPMDGYYVTFQPVTAKRNV
jgi:hypothetical protein